ncbi:dioxygenase family protein [Piscinibacter sakaiensis]|uniref:Protocatechuate 3,4-dioxygenase, beta chain n=1 Tax=Piscinibacter sakaiensis TaxID=1547922 RepID=A0A0K8NXM7_PISS1|nr:hypothetical protein [Piscinibacter sakaiensis]GAP35059.1 protocatechuate 3,4-dioxygenase, beta chain [Piscinibacter sakaiensis]
MPTDRRPSPTRAAALPAPQRRRLLLGAGAGAGAALLALPRPLRAAGLPPMTEGPFYPSVAWRARALDWDADLTRVERGGRVLQAQGEALDLGGRIVDARGRAVDGAAVEIWQCDVHGSYRHPDGAGERIDEGFQGFGATRSDAAGRYRFRTIRPVPYPGRTPHIHVRLRHPAWGELTSQLFVDGEPANARDFLYRRLTPDDRRDTALVLQPAEVGAPVAWRASRDLHVGA